MNNIYTFIYLRPFHSAIRLIGLLPIPLLMLVQLPVKISGFAKYTQDDLRAVTFSLIIFLGVGFRLFHYLYNRSLWTDEIYLSAGIVEMTFKELLSDPLPYLQKAPLGYLLISHLFVVSFGSNDMVLRLLSILTGVGSLFLFLPVARHFLKPLGAIVALAIVAFAPPLVCHSVEAKPYGTDLFVTILILWLYIRYEREIRINKLIIWGLWGSLLVWFSYPSIFVLLGIAITVGVSHVIKGNWKVVLRLAIPFGMWVVSFLLSYFLYAKEGSGAGWLVYFFVKYNGYFPLTPTAGAVWLMRRSFSFLHHPLGLTWINDFGTPTHGQRFIKRMAAVPLLLAFPSLLYFFERSKKYLLLVAILLLLALTTSALKLYPFHERMTVYLAPLIILLLAGGCDYLVKKNGAIKYLGYGLALLLIVGPIKNLINEVINPHLFGDYKKSYYREALQYVDNNYRKGDGVYIYWNGVAGYKYYKLTDNLKFSGILGKDYRHFVDNYGAYFTKLDAELAEVYTKERVWIIHSVIDMNQGDYADQPTWYYNGKDFRTGYGVQQFRQHLLRKGKILKTYAPSDGNKKPDVRVSLMSFN